MELAFQIRSRWIDDQTFLVEPHGEIDIATAPHLEKALGMAFGHAPATLVLDLRGVDFIDSRGVGLIQSAHQQLRAAGASLKIVCRAAHLRRVLDLASDADVSLDVVDAYAYV